MDQPTPLNVDTTWVSLLHEVLSTGCIVSPRGMKTKEMLGAYSIHATYAVLSIPERKLNYRFMAAEPLWIMAGHDDVDGIAKYNAQIANYAPLGDRFFGAYGPRWVKQRDAMIDKLLADRDTRQAVVSFWTDNPPDGVDVACNILLVFSIRGRQLNLTVSARSKDIWLGLPYDVFGFSMLLHRVLCVLNGTRRNGKRYFDPPLLPGLITFFDSSLHIYERYWDAAVKIVQAYHNVTLPSELVAIPYIPACDGDWNFYQTYLTDRRELKDNSPLFSEMS